jgi:hypothetical protein
MRNQRDGQFLAFRNGRDAPLELLRLAVRVQRHDIRIEDDHPFSRSARVSASRSSKSPSSRNTPNC